MAYNSTHLGTEVDDAIGTVKGSGTGILVKTGTGSGERRSIAGTTDEVSVSNGSGVAGNPTISLAAAVKASLALADSAQQPPSEGAFVDGDKTKLDGIEAGADVTDSANVKTAIEGISLSSVSGATGDGMLMIDATDGELKRVLWENLPSGGGGLSDLVDDLTPQLGGDLDINGNDIVSTSNANIRLLPDGTGDVVLGNYTLDADATVGASQDNHVLTYDHSTGKWGPESVAVASETDPVVGAVTGIVKADGAGNISAAVADTDYQSVLAEGAFADGDKTKLDGIEAGADVTDSANVSAAGAAMTSTLASTANGAGASTIGVEDAAGNYTATNVEAVLAEIATDIAAAGGDSWGDAVNADIIPDADGTRDLGSTSNRFAELHVDSIDLSGNTITATATKTAPTGDVVGTSDTQTLTNKTLTAPVLGGTITGTYTLGGTPTFPATVVSTTGTQTLTNKTLTSPKIAHNYNAQTGTTYTLVAGDQSSVITMSNASANTLTIPPNSSVAFPIGTVIQIWQIGAGTTTIAGGTGVTLSGNGGSGSAYSCDIQTQYGGATITKIATDQWMVAGDIDAVAA